MSSFTRSESGFMKKKKKLVKSRMDVKRSPNELNKGAWTEEEDRHLAEVIAINGPRKWKTIATTAGLRRCGKSCRLRWLNYLRPNIKRGNMSDQEEDLILRLHKLLGNRWSLIAGRLPGRTDNEIKNYWNSHLSKRKRQSLGLKIQEENNNSTETEHKKETLIISTTTTVSTSDSFNTDDFFDFSNENPIHLEWVSRFLK